MLNETQIRIGVVLRPLAGQVTRLALQSSVRYPRWCGNQSAKPQSGNGKANHRREVSCFGPNHSTKRSSSNVSCHGTRRVRYLCYPAANGEHRLELPERFQPEAEPGLVRLSDEARQPGSRWSYTSTTPSPLITSTIPERSTPKEATIVSHVWDQHAEHDFTAIVPPRRTDLVMNLPAGLKAWEALVNDLPVSMPGGLVIAASPEPARVRLRYRTRGNRFLGIHWAGPVIPSIGPNSEDFPVRQEWFFPTKVAVGPNLQAASHARLPGTFVILEGPNQTVWWVESDVLVSLALLVALGLIMLGRRLPLSLVCSLLILVGVLAWWLPAAWMVVPLLLLLGLVPAVLPLRLLLTRRLLSLKTLGLVAMLMLPWRVPGRATGTPRSCTSSPASDGRMTGPCCPCLFGRRCSLFARQDIAGIPGRVEVSSVSCRAELIQQRLRITSTWTVEVRGEGTADLAWPGPIAVSEVRLDDAPLQPQLVPGPFGLRQLSMRLPRAGRFTLQVSWEAPLPRADLEQLRAGLTGCARANATSDTSRQSRRIDASGCRGGAGT